MAEPVTGVTIEGIREEVLLTHEPTGVMATGATRGEALGKLTMVLVGRGDITINQGRAALGLKPFDLAPREKQVADETTQGKRTEVTVREYGTDGELVTEIVTVKTVRTPEADAQPEPGGYL